MGVALVAASLVFAFVLGVGDAGNASAALIGTGSAPPGRVLAMAFAAHAVGVLVTGTAVAATLVGLVDLPGHELPVVFLAGAVAAVVTTSIAARRGVPLSASYALVGGLTGAAVVVGGPTAVVWGGADGLRPVGVLGAVGGMLVSPVIGLVAAYALRRGLRRPTRRLTRRAARPLRGGLWVTAALVGLADGGNDGQKALAVAAVGVVAVDPGRAVNDDPATWLRVAIAVTLAAGTVLGGTRVIRTVARGLYRELPLDGFAAQVAAAAVIVGAGRAGAPVSTSEVVAGGVVGAGSSQRPRHVRWLAVQRTVAVWAVSIPVAAAAGACCALVLRWWS